MSAKVKTRRTQREHNESAYVTTADIQADVDLRRFGPILLQNSLKCQSRSDSVMLMRIGEADDDGAE